MPVNVQSNYVMNYKFIRRKDYLVEIPTKPKMFTGFPYHPVFPYFNTFITGQGGVSPILGSPRMGPGWVSYIPKGSSGIILGGDPGNLFSLFRH